MPRSAEAGQAKEATATMRAGMLILSLACVLFGILPFLVTPVISRSVASIFFFALQAYEMGAGLLMRAPGASSTISPPILTLGLASVIVAVALGFRLFRVNRSMRSGETWGCGRVVQSARME